MNIASKKRVCVFTGTRADYGLLRPLMTELTNNTKCKLQILVSGMHLCPEFGLTYQAIEEDGFIIDEKVEILLSSDTTTGISTSMSLGIMGYNEALLRLQPDIVVILGDRFEALSMAIAAMLNRIPIAHLHGGEITSGVIDEPIRHSITKMSHLHFTSTEEYRRRVIQLGEEPTKVFHVGALGIENIQTLKLLSRKQLTKVIGFGAEQDFALVTFHPLTLEKANASEQFTELLKALEMFPKLKIIFTKANADMNGRVINSLIDLQVKKEPERCQSFTSMGQLNYLSAMQYCKTVIGNSSSGIIEAPSFQVPTINIGNRQQGRLQATSIIDCAAETKAISQALQTAFSKNFKILLSQTTNPYEKQGTAKNIATIIQQTNLDNIIKKEFHDIPLAN